MTTPDKGIQKIVVQKSSLPTLDSSNRYFVRYRVKTSDENLVTAWSPVYRIEKPSIEEMMDTEYSVAREIKSHGKSFDVSWNLIPSIPPQIDGLPLDVYVKWHDSENWTFVTTTTANSFSVPIPEDFQSTSTDTYTASFMVHLATSIKNRLSTDLSTLVFVETGVPTKAVYDAGSIV